MPKIKGRLMYKGYISPAPPRGATLTQKRFLAKVYGELRSKHFRGENPKVKSSASRIARYVYSKKFN